MTPDFEPGALSPLNVQGAVNDLYRFVQTDHARFPTGWSVDDTCGQVGSGELALWIARSGSGKSTAYLNIIRNTPEIPTLVVNMEMTPRRQIEWLLSMTYDLDCKGRDIEGVLRWGPDDPRYGEVAQALDNLGERFPSLTFVTPSRPAVADLQFVVEDIENASGVRPQRIFIDHVGLMAGGEEFSGTVKNTSGLHSWAMKEDLAIYALQQTGRNDGSGGRNDGHLPLTMSSGMFGGEADADWVFGMYRPDRNPKFKKSRYQFEHPEDYYKMLSEREQVAGITVLQVLKNRPFSDLMEDGVELKFDPWTRRLEEIGVFGSEAAK